MLIKSKKIVLENETISGGFKVNNGKIESILYDYDLIEADLDFGEKRIIPGLFDTHIHGTHGYNLSGLSSDPEADLKKFSKALASEGITAVFPTYCIIVDTKHNDKMLSVIAELTSKELDGAKIMGIHYEGPWLNRAGENGIRPGWPEVSQDVCTEILKLSKGQLKLMAISPEIEGIEPIMDMLLANNVTLAYAHSDLSFADAWKAYDKGISVTTHTGNVMVGIHHRDVGGLGAALLRDDVAKEIICDGKHLSMEMVDIMLRVIPNEKIMLVSDSTNMAGAPEGRYSGWDENMIITIDKKGYVLSDTGRICGSSKSILVGVKNLVKKLNVPIHQAVQYASLNPFTVYGFGKERGSISKGKYADFVVVDEEFKVYETYVEGKKVFDVDIDTNLFNLEFLEERKITNKSL